jgi:biotin/methionine sulfoxide reductase
MTRVHGLPHSSHWGAFSVSVRARDIEVIPHPRDFDPSCLLGNLPASVAHKARIAQPMARRGWLENGPGPDTRRGADQFVALSWPGFRRNRRSAPGMVRDNRSAAFGEVFTCRYPQRDRAFDGVCDQDTAWTHAAPATL